MSITATPPTATRPESGGDARIIRVLGSRRASLAFAAIVFLTTAIQVLSIPVTALADGSGTWTHPLPLSTVTLIVAAVIAVQASSLLLILRRPRIAVMLTVLCYGFLVVVIDVPTWLTAMQFVVAIALFLLSAQVSARIAISWFVIAVFVAIASLIAWGALLGAPANAVVAFVVEQGISLVAPAAGATALGIWWGASARRVERIRADAETATREQEERIERARVQERARIAQELHDVAAQHIAGLLSLADGALGVDVTDIDEALQLIEDMRTEGRFASASVYSALRDLRAVDGKRTAKTPDLLEVEALLHYWRQRGMIIESRFLGERAGLPAVVSTSAYRGVQEALTNAAKHAPGSTVRADVIIDDSWLKATVENGPPRGVRADEDRIGLGWGLEGLRGRIRLLSGTVEAGPTAAGGWRLKVEIPILEIETPDGTTS